MADAYNPIEFCYAPGDKHLIERARIGNIQTVYGYGDLSACQELQKNANRRKEAVAQVDVLNGMFPDQIEGFEKGIGEKPDEMFY
jgi:hypothetical protein